MPELHIHFTPCKILLFLLRMLDPVKRHAWLCLSGAIQCTMLLHVRGYPAAPTRSQPLSPNTSGEELSLLPALCNAVDEDGRTPR